MSSDSVNAATIAPSRSAASLRESASRHLWRAYIDMTIAEDEPLPIIVRGEGCYLEDIEGRRFLDGLSNLMCVNLGYSYGAEMGEAAAAQFSELGYHSNWGSTHLPAIELAEEVATLAPDGLEHVFFTPTGGESIEAALKMARQYHTLRGERRWKAIARNQAYHGGSLGALTLNGNTRLRGPFEPLVPSAGHTRNTNRYRRPSDETEAEFTTVMLDELEQRIIAEDPETVARMVIEPVQHSGGALVPPAGYHAGVRALCDRYGILLLADEVVTAFGRLGAWFGSERYELEPDMIAIAKGLSSAHAVMGAVIASEQVFQTFNKPGVEFTHGNTFGGHPVQTAVALKNLEILKREEIPARVSDKEGELRAALDSLGEIPIVGDVRGAGFLYALELVADKETKAPFDDETAKVVNRANLTRRFAEQGLLTRVEPGIYGNLTVSICPPLVADTAEFELIRSVLQTTLSEASAAL